MAVQCAVNCLVDVQTIIGKNCYSNGKGVALNDVSFTKSSTHILSAGSE
jgi:hypothetical protein